MPHGNIVPSEGKVTPSPCWGRLSAVPPNLKWGKIALRWSIGGVLLYAGVAKMLSPLTFYAALQKMEWMPELLRQSVATVLPPLEVLMGLSLILNLYASTSWQIVAVLTPIFITFHLLYPGGCGCFGE